LGYVTTNKNTPQNRLKDRPLYRLLTQNNMEQQFLIKPTFTTASNYNKGLEYNIYCLFDTVHDYINKPKNITTAYGWLAENPKLVIEIVKGIHTTDREMAKHFNIKVNKHMYHAYVKIVQKYNITNPDGIIKSATTLEITKLTMVMGQ
tara:strand:- start:35 stop:478 length:444 start_codon:yes stop_codon:yes gene_type:complete